MVDLVQVALSILTFLGSGSLAYYLAKKYGDVAGTEAAIEFEKEKAAKARIVALQSLLNEVMRIRDLAHHNSKLTRHHGSSIQSVVRMPVAAFETAFLSGESSLFAEGKGDTLEPFASVTAYLTEAYSINVLIDIYLGLVRGLSRAENSQRADVITEIVDKSQGLSEILDRLEKYLGCELEGRN
jgi:hypothetical protein